MAFTEGIITPIILKLLAFAGVNSNPTAITTIFGIDFKFGLLITAIITFIIIMFVAFSAIKAYAKIKTRFEKEVEESHETEVIAPTASEELLMEIRDLLKEK